MNFSNDVFLTTIVIILFIIGAMIAAGFGYFFGRRSKDLTKTLKESPSEDDFIKEDFSQIKIHQGEHSVAKRNWLAISRNLILFLIVVLLTGGGIYYYFLQKGVETASVKEEQTDIQKSLSQADNPINNQGETLVSSSQDQKEKDTSKWGNYTNSTYNYSLRHPEDYGITTDDIENITKISPPESTSLWLEVEVQPNPDQLPSGAYASKFPPEGEVEKRANLVIAGIPSVRLETKTESITYVANGHQVIIFKLPLASSPDGNSEDLTNLKRIITTLKFK